MYSKKNPTMSDKNTIPISHDHCVGHFVEKRNVGRPGPDSVLTKVWHNLCNFGIVIKGRVSGENNGRDNGNRDKMAGWLVEMSMLQNEKLVKKEVYLKVEECLSKAGLTRAFAASMSGAISTLSPSEFHALIADDLPVYKLLSYCGKHHLEDWGSYVWVYPGCTLSSTCQICNEGKVFVTRESLMTNGSNIPLNITYPPIDVELSQSRASFVTVLNCVKEYFNRNFTRALHVVALGFLALNRQTIMKEEKQMAIANVSGIPNIGKTMLSNLVCQILNCDYLIMSRCSLSAVNSLSSSFSNLLIIWDDPRDLSASQAESLVHEFFHGLASTTQAYGNRFFRSSLLIGTQSPNLGHNLSSATKSRISNIRFTEKNDGVAEMSPECFRNSKNCFRAFTHIPFDACLSRANKLYHRYSKEYPHIMTRTLKSLALEASAMELVCRLGNMGDDVRSSIHEYVESVVIPYAEENCSTEDALDSFIQIIKKNMSTLSRSHFKKEVNISKDGMRLTYVAMVVDRVLKELQSQGIRTPNHASIHKSLQMRRSLGFVEMNRNVNFEGVVRRCTVIQQVLFDCNSISNKPCLYI